MSSSCSTVPRTELFNPIGNRFSSPARVLLHHHHHHSKLSILQSINLLINLFTNLIFPSPEKEADAEYIGEILL